jgi:hypothetical protein
MLKIILKDGQELLNDENLGMNLDTKEGIEEALSVEGYYELFTKEKGWQRIYSYEIKEIVSA